jgi:peptide-methionine (S)-S-oxide reductase|tara:strand:+ start:39 stop:653 length:615 start_codon:yes stop_codon:yes gene_type:complete
MLKVIFFIVVLFNLSSLQTLAGVLSVTSGDKESEYKKAYFAGGCFWCMEESFDKVKGVIKSISGYSGGHVKNPTYKQVVYKDTGHVEAIEVYYNPELTSYEELLKVFWVNIDPFDAKGQFCDKGKSYRSVAFYQNIKQKKLIENSITNIEKKFNKKKIVTLVWEFKKFYPAEDYHQDYYQNNFLRYLAYKSSCQREEILNRIWN